MTKNFNSDGFWAAPKMNTNPINSKEINLMANTGNARISCVICAFNEAPRIASVLAIVAAHPLLQEVIVVDDGSSDRTAEIVRGFPSVTLISLTENHGKSFAMATGIAHANSEFIMLLDADLRGLQDAHLTALAAPVLSGETDISLSLRRNSLLIFRAIGLDFVSGERVMRKDVLSDALAEMRGLPRFGIEVFMNRRIISRRLSIAVAHWPQVMQARKTEKIGYWKGVSAEWRMLADLLHCAYPTELLAQNYHLLVLRTRGRGMLGVNPGAVARGGFFRLPRWGARSSS